MTGGYYGKILHVNLTTSEIKVEEPPEEIYRLLIGGRGLASYLLLRDLPRNIDPLDPENILMFVPGIFQGTNLPGSGRHGVAALSPLTGAIGSSESGGWWGHEFKRTGYDALVVTGRAAEPVYLWIKDQEVEIRSAKDLWGLKTFPVQEAIRKELGDEKVKVAQIGPAGENLVKYSAIMHDVNRASGRNGMGAVMGSKNLKAVAVRGSHTPKIVDKKRFAEVVKWYGDNFEEKAVGLHKGRGTQDGLAYLATVGLLPTRNFGQAVFEDEQLLSGERNYEMFLKERDTCAACPIACKSTFQNESDDPYKHMDPVYGGAEYEAMGALGSVCDVHDNLSVLKANEFCNAFGLDPISTGMSIGFVMECFENGVINKEDTGGLEFHWGDGDMLVRSVEMIALRKDFGDVMAEGVARMTERFGPEAEPFNMTVKKQELPMHEPRGKYALGVGYALAPVGADHMMNMHDVGYTREGGPIDNINTLYPEGEGVKAAPVTTLDENKMKIFYAEVNYSHFQDCGLICMFQYYQYSHMAEALSAVTGWEYSIKDIIDIGARANTLSRLFNLREGFTAEDDIIPKRVMTAFTEGPIKGNEIADDDFFQARSMAYHMMGWDAETGVPTDVCFEKYGLTELMKGLKL